MSDLRQLPREIDATTIALDRAHAVDMALHYPQAVQLYAMQNTLEQDLPPPARHRRRNHRLSEEPKYISNPRANALGSSTLPPLHAPERDSEFPDGRVGPEPGRRQSETRRG
jgi:hypothetical protein